MDTEESTPTSINLSLDNFINPFKKMGTSALIAFTAMGFCGAAAIMIRRFPKFVIKRFNNNPRIKKPRKARRILRRREIRKIRLSNERIKY